MSIPVSAEPGGRLTAAARARALLAVGAARLLVLLPPARLARVLRLVSRGSRPATAAEALAARTAAVTVSARCAGLGCTQRSVAAALLCRAHGAWPDWCAGFRTRPFAAHAWVEVGGVPIGEPPGIGGFRTVLSARHPGEGGHDG